MSQGMFVMKVRLPGVRIYIRAAWQRAKHISLATLDRIGLH